MFKFKSVLLSCFASLSLILLFPAQASGEGSLDKFQWSYDTDPYGSEAIINEKLIRHSAIWIKLKRAASTDKKRKTWVELIHKLPQGSLAGFKTISLTYHSDSDLLVKLPQNETFQSRTAQNNAYQFSLPATKSWQTVEMKLSEFKQPDNAIAYEEFILEKIKRIYFVPVLNKKKTSEGIIQIRSIALLP